MIESFKLPNITPETISGAICSFNDEYGNLPLKSHSVEVVATQSGSGTPSPSNPRPISGYSAINISHSDADTSTPTVYTIQIGSTVYGGVYDAITGVMTINKLYVDLTQFSWERRGEQPNPNGTIYEAGFICPEITSYTDLISNIGVAGNGNYNTSGANSIWVNAARTGIRWIWGLPNGGSSLSDLQSFISNNDCYAVFTCAPYTIQLTPVPIETYEGQNNIFADCGDTEVKRLKVN